MRVNNIRPCFKGLVNFEKEKVAINTNSVSVIKANPKATEEKPETFILFHDGSRLTFKYRYEDILNAYSRSSFKNDNIVNVKQEG